MATLKSGSHKDRHREVRIVPRRRRLFSTTISQASQEMAGPLYAIAEILPGKSTPVERKRPASMPGTLAARLSYNNPGPAMIGYAHHPVVLDV